MSAKTDHPQNFAYVVGVACSHFEVLERLIRQELRIVSDTGEDELSRLHAIGALAQSFIFHVSRAYRMCEHQRDVLSKDPDKRKAFLRYIESRGLVEVRDVNEHGFDPPNAGKTSLPSATEQIAMNIPTQTNDAESGISPDSDEGLSCLSRRNMILGGAAVVAAISLPKNSLASMPLSTTDQPFEEHQWKG